MSRADNSRTLVVRLFSDHAQSPIWLDIGPVDYQEARLSESLESDLRAWDALHYQDDDRSKGWSSQDVEGEIVATGQRLAQRLARELGSDFEVEVDSDARRPAKTRFRSRKAAINPEAEDAFRALARDS